LRAGHCRSNLRHENHDKKGDVMAEKGKTQLVITFVATPDKVSEIDRLVESHGSWMAKTHYRDGSKALRSYNFAKGPELENPLDPSSKSTGNTRYVLNEIYESPAGVEDHWNQAQDSWSDFGKMVEMIGGCNPQTLHGGSVTESLW